MRPVWLFDLDNTLHDAGASAFRLLDRAMNEYIARELGVDVDEADQLRRHYWQRYGATLLGLIRHHGVQPPHFLDETHRLPGLEERVRSHRHDIAAVKRLPGRKYILTNGPRAYTERVLRVLGIARCFDGVIAIEQMRMFGQWRPKPDTRMLRKVAAHLRVSPSHCVLVEDTLDHQKAARSVGFRTVWMQRWLKHNGVRGEVGVYLLRRPMYVCARIRSLQQLHKSAR
ncbi:MAG TPA: pyrimidine 5'-nucleotidase [Burkholderiaceae bacterium]|nr:pyrimidine 5'-nucleotidase [Burkholderiaceae bacterium]